MTEEKRKTYAKLGALVTLLTMCEMLKSAKNSRSKAEDVKAAAEDYLELCDEEEDDT